MAVKVNRWVAGVRRLVYVMQDLTHYIILVLNTKLLEKLLLMEYNKSEEEKKRKRGC